MLNGIALSTRIPRNQWYVAVYGSEIGDELFPRTICGEPVVFFRDSGGGVVALADRRVHCRFPRRGPVDPVLDL
jgi:phenylpropionate dioxygenase-like ring-hydroxylating dioxygenase large terminal subunit